MASIYLIRNLVNGKRYVGQTVMSVGRRWDGHKSDAKRNDTFLYQSMRKHGIENFTIEEVVSCDSSLLNDLEKHYIKFYGTHFSTGHGYNLTDGADNPPSAKGLKRTPETLIRMSAAAKNRPPMSAEDRRKCSETAKRIGHRPTPEAIEKARILHTGKPLSQKAITAAADYHRGEEKASGGNCTATSNTSIEQSKKMPASGMTVTLSIDASELERDLERIDNGELELPTVSAVQVSCDGVFEEQVVIWLSE
jgi:group I intron endonuclease